MELPVAPQTYRPSADALVRAVKRVEVMLGRMAARETPLAFATVFTNAERPAIEMANFVADLRPTESESAETALATVLQTCDEANVTCHRLMASDTVWPKALAAAAEQQGYIPEQCDLMLLSRYTPPSRRHDALQIIPGRAAYPQLRAFCRQAAKDRHGLDEKTADDLAATRIDHLDEPRVETFLGRLAGQAVGSVTLVTLGQIGVIQDVYTVPEHRGRGIALTLLAHAMDHCQRALFEQVVLETDCDNVPAHRLYAQLGFGHVTRFDHYIRRP